MEACTNFHTSMEASTNFMEASTNLHGRRYKIRGHLKPMDEIDGSYVRCGSKRMSLEVTRSSVEGERLILDFH